MSYYRENPDYMQGWRDGFAEGWDRRSLKGSAVSTQDEIFPYEKRQAKKKKRKKVSAYNRFVKECAKKPRFKYKSGKKKGMLNMKAIGVAWRKKRK